VIGAFLFVQAANTSLPLAALERRLDFGMVEVWPKEAVIKADE
jgi:hypothetical protein